MRLGDDGSTEKEGYVEALGFNGQWGGICVNNFDINDANVICKMLGFPSATGFLGYPYGFYGTAPSGNNFVLSKLECTGKEASVFDCGHDGEWIADCKKKEIAGVQCGTSKL